MLASDQKVQEKQNSTSTPQPIEKSEELPPEINLAIIYMAAKRLEAQGFCQVLTGSTSGKKPVTYIRMTGVVIDPKKGFVLAKESANTQSVGTEA